MMLALVSWIAALSMSVLAAAQSQAIATGSNATYSVPTDTTKAIWLLLSMSSQGTSYYLAALTPEATQIVQDETIEYPNGTLVERDPSNLGQPIDGAAIAYISCDASDYPGYTDINNVVDNAVNANVSAIVLYSQILVQCNLTGDAPNGYTKIYTMTAQDDAKGVLGSLDAIPMAFILNTKTLRQVSNGGAASSSSFGTRSTAVAMIILYSITGIITALFLLIIVSGAVRAHRHPERYGPRNVGGRSRQSRARGIARAMLETIPIVKFGDNDPPKDVEMSEAADSSSRDGRVANTASTNSANRVAATSEVEGSATSATTTSAPGTQAASGTAMNDSSSPGRDEDLVACSICTEDFEKGQDIRLLPCNHKFHPACVDPWLLDVSGTCPLCRVDLRPTETSGHAAQEGDMPPPLDPAAADAANSNSTGGRLRGLLRRLQPSTAEERIAALRRFREENAQAGEAAGTEAHTEEGHASRWERVRRRVGL